MSTDSVSVVAPAKINLALQVTGRRADGMHELDTVAVPLDLADRVTATLCSEPKCTNTWSLPGLDEDQELGLRAARLLAERAKVRSGVTLQIDKCIPLGSGLGGSSSDAAAVLLACNRLWQLRWPMVQLAKLGAELGADVPFFIYCRQARMRGIGDKLSYLSKLHEGWCVICVPKFSCSTSAVYAQYDRQDLTKSSPQDKIVASAMVANDLVDAALALYPQLAQALQCVAAVADNVRMSGSGSACYALFDRRKAAWLAAEKLAQQQMQVWVARIMHDRSNGLGSGQAVRQRILDPSIVGSNPTSPASSAASSADCVQSTSSLASAAD